VRRAVMAADMIGCGDDLLRRPRPAHRIPRHGPAVVPQALATPNCSRRPLRGAGRAPRRLPTRSPPREHGDGPVPARMPAAERQPRSGRQHVV